jgi:hypothetical protein
MADCTVTRTSLQVPIGTRAKGSLASGMAARRIARLTENARSP